MTTTTIRLLSSWILTNVLKLSIFTYRVLFITLQVILKDTISTFYKPFLTKFHIYKDLTFLQFYNNFCSHFSCHHKCCLTVPTQNYIFGRAAQFEFKGTKAKLSNVHGYCQYFYKQHFTQEKSNLVMALWNVEWNITVEYLQ